MLEQKMAQRMFIRKIIIALLLIAFGIGGYLADREILQPMYAERKAALESNAGFVRMINSVNNERKSYSKMLSDLGKEFGKINSDKEEYISYLGHVAVENRLNVEKITVGDIEQIGDNIYSLNMKIELEGEMYNIKNMMQELADSNKISQVNSFSYRQIQTDASGSLLSWLTRSFDGDTLIKWWSGISGGAKSVENVTNTTQTQKSSNNQTRVLTADDLLQQNPVKYYLDIDFIGSGG